MGKRKRNVAFSNEFFNVYLSDFSSQQLSLPPAFVAQFNGNNGRTLPKNDVTLKDYNGKIWNVGLVRDENDLIIKDGWKDFADCHSLADGDFLIFKYDGGSQFDVKLYGVNGLKKDGKGVDNNNMLSSTFVKVKEEQRTEEEFVSGGSKPKDSEIEPRRTRSYGLSGGSDSKSSKTNAAKPGERNVAKTPSSVARKNARFVVNISKSLRSVYVPISLLKAHGIKFPRVMQLRDEKKKLWPVHTSFLDNGQIRLTTGWIEFCRKKKLKVGDQCVLEFILAKDNVSYVIEVQVLHRRSGARSVKHGSFGGNPSKLSETNETGLAVALKRKHSAMKTNPRGQNISKEGTSTGWEWCEDKAQRMEPEVRNDETGGLDKANCFKSENPYFRIVMQPTHVPPRPALCIPITFSREYIPERKVDVILSLPDGPTWNCGLSIEVHHGYSRARVAYGWSAFARHNHLKVGDICIFELIDIEEIVFRVHIFRSARGSDSR